MTFIDEMFNPKQNKEANLIPQGENKQDHFEKKVKAHAWVNGILDLDEKKVEADFLAAQAEEARMLGKTAAQEFKTPEEVIESDYSRQVKTYSDYNLTEMLALARAYKDNVTMEKFAEYKESAKKNVESGRTKCEEELLKLTGTHTLLDWKKAFDTFTKDAKVEQPTEKDLFEPKSPEKEHNFEKPSEDKFKMPTKDEMVPAGNGREADQRTEVTKEAVPVIKEASLTKEAKDVNKMIQMVYQIILMLQDDALYGPAVESLYKAMEELKLAASMDEDVPPVEASKRPKVEKKADPYQPKASQTKKADYEGWKNSETWQVALWLDNDQALNAASAELAQTVTDQNQLAEALKNLVEEAKPDLGASLWDDMINWAMAEVDWMEVANHFNSKFSEASKLPKVEKKADVKECDECTGSGLEGFEGTPCTKCHGTGKQASSMSPLKREELPVQKEGCPVCGSLEGKDLNNGAKDHMSCMACGITYGDKVEACASGIQSHASKADVLKKVAEVQSPWVVQKLEDGTEVIARVEQPTNTKESEEKKEEEIQK